MHPVPFPIPPRDDVKTVQAKREGNKRVKKDSFLKPKITHFLQIAYILKYFGSPSRPLPIL